MAKGQQKRLGRPKAAETMVLVPIRWPRAMIEAVDAIVEKDNPAGFDRSTVLRVLVAEALDARKAQQRGKR